MVFMELKYGLFYISQPIAIVLFFLLIDFEEVQNNNESSPKAEWSQKHFKKMRNKNN